MPIHLAAQQGHKNIVGLFLDQNSSIINIGNELGWTALHVACWAGQTEVIALLLARKARGDQGNNYGWTPAHAAAWNGKEEALETLREYKVYYDNGNNDGWKPLHVAVCRNKLSTIKWLVNIGNVDVAVKSSDWWMPLHIACWLDHVEIVKFLIGDTDSSTIKSSLEYSKEIWSKSIEGVTIFHLAAANKKLEVLKYLVQKRGVFKNDMHKLLSDHELSMDARKIIESEADQEPPSVLDESAIIAEPLDVLAPNMVATTTTTTSFTAFNQNPASQQESTQSHQSGLIVAYKTLLIHREYSATFTLLAHIIDKIPQDKEAYELTIKIYSAVLKNASSVTSLVKQGQEVLEQAISHIPGKDIKIASKMADDSLLDKGKEDLKQNELGVAKQMFMLVIQHEPWHKIEAYINLANIDIEERNYGKGMYNFGEALESCSFNSSLEDIKEILEGMRKLMGCAEADFPY